MTRKKIPTGTSDCYNSCPGLALSKPGLVPQPSSSRAEVIAPIGSALWENAKNCDSCSIQETLTKLVSNQDRNSICLSWVLLFQHTVCYIFPLLQEPSEKRVVAGLAPTAYPKTRVPASSEVTPINPDFKIPVIFQVNPLVFGW